MVKHTFINDLVWPELTSASSDFHGLEFYPGYGWSVHQPQKVQEKQEPVPVPGHDSALALGLEEFREDGH